MKWGVNKQNNAYMQMIIPEASMREQCCVKCAQNKNMAPKIIGKRSTDCLQLKQEEKLESDFDGNIKLH